MFYCTLDLKCDTNLCCVTQVHYPTYELSSSDHLRLVSLQNSAYPDLPIKLALQLAFQLL
jgi:hypothetical protein